MDPEDHIHKPQATGKIRVSHGGRIRAKPYSRKKVKQPEEPEIKVDQTKGFLGKVASYVVPQWISSWFSSSKPTIKEEDEGSDRSENEDVEDEDGDNEDTNYSSKERPTLSSKGQNLLVANHVIQPRPKKNITSTPMVRNMPSFAIMSSEVRDPKEGPSNQSDDAFEGGSTTKRSSSQLLTVDMDDSDDALPPIKQERTEKGPSLLNSFQFSMGTKPIGPPQRFLTAKNRPSFKVSSFVSSSPLLPDTSSQSSSFYPGRTSFGGASSLQNRTVKRQRVSPVALSTRSRKANIKPKSLSNLKMTAVTSDTARKILGALERMSSPVQDASKLPGSPSSVLFNPPKKAKESLFNSPVNRSKWMTNPPPTSVLVTPQSLQIQQLEKRKTEQPILRFSEIRQSVPVGTFKSRGLPTSFSPEESHRAGGKMRQPRKSSHQPAVKEIEDEPVNTLPEIRNAPALIISSLPKISFDGITVSTASTTTGQPSVIKEKSQTGSDKVVAESFRFSAPGKISDENVKPVGKTVTNTFQFSIPVAKESTEQSKNSKRERNEKAAISKTNDLAESNNTVSSLKSGAKTEMPSQSIFSSKFMSEKKSGWECNTCMLFNTDDQTVCRACNSSKHGKKEPGDKPKNTKKASPTPQENVAFNSEGAQKLRNKFKAPEGSWECPQCMVSNSAGSESCMACSASRSTNGREDQNEAHKPAMNRLVSKFKGDDGSWECPVCMLKNKPISRVCIACKAKKPIGEDTKENSTAFGGVLKEKFAPRTGSWECGTCMLRNDSDKDACISCSSAKPGTNLGAAPPDPVSSLKAKFAAKEPTWECEACMLQNKMDASSCIACAQPKKGTSAPTQSTAPSFSFGTASSSGTGSMVKFGASTDSNKGLAFGETGTVGFRFGESSGAGSASFGGKGFAFSNNDGFSFDSIFKGSASSPIKGTDSLTTASNSANGSGSINFGSSKGFSFGAPKVVKDSSDTKNTGKSKKTEENNNWSSVSPGKSLFTTSGAAKEPEIKSTLGAKDPVKAFGGVKSIADAAKAGLLKVPGVGADSPDPASAVAVTKAEDSKAKDSNAPFGTSWNGPVSNDTGSKTTDLFGKSSPKKTTGDDEMQPVANTDSNPFVFGSVQQKNQNASEATPASGFNFAAQLSANEPKSVSSSFSFGSGNPSIFNSGPEAAGAFQSSIQLAGKPTDSLKSNKVADSFGTGGKFSFGQSSEQKAAPLFGTLPGSSESKMTSPFQFNTNAVNPKIPVLGQNSVADAPLASGQNPFGNSTARPVLTTNAESSKAESKPFAFSSNPMPSMFQNPKKSLENPFESAITNLFDFATNANKSATNSFSFGSQQEQNTGAQENVNRTVNSIGNSISFPNTTSNSTEAKPFSFSGLSGGSRDSSQSSNMFTSSAPAGSGPTAGSVPAGNVPTAGFNFGSSAGFSFGANSNANAIPSFSVGAGLTPPANRPIHRAVRRSRK